MFESLLRRLLAPEPDRLPEPDSRLALAALLVRVGRADGHYSAPETERIDAVLRCRYGLDAAAAAALRREAEILEEEAPDTVRFTRAVKEHVAYEDRLGVIEALWEVALADGRRDAEEDGLMRLVAPLLGVEDVDSGLARQRVEARLDGGASGEGPGGAAGGGPTGPWGRAGR
ncbi:TerB family tellurite resistance protein [Rubellimicrobium sp. CFH 75288]|uniref:tellurite resistance TerB family protein n=1 Tax=Rubellimicrobium sp. CFH 75288 TaxID=2697034 RepID=UPI00141265F8|nr:TerB family tellurite resistance protein [Rubellimicrobium sp. CFH 75288]NAZ37075.1 TerB family tellurite resistance protein [Rubellimicrobium sp. CFH 75288]